MLRRRQSLRWLRMFNLFNFYCSLSYFYRFLMRSLRRTNQAVFQLRLLCVSLTQIHKSHSILIPVLANVRLTSRPIILKGSWRSLYNTCTVTVGKPLPQARAGSAFLERSQITCCSRLLFFRDAVVVPVGMAWLTGWMLSLGSQPSGAVKVK